MADISQLLQDLGVHPELATNRRPGQIVTPSRRVTARSKAKPIRMPSASGFGTGRKSNGVAPVTVNVPIPDAPAEEDSGWGSIGDMFIKALKIVDTPRAYLVSGMDQLARVVADPFSDADSHASWDDFLKNAEEHTGFGTYLAGQQHGGSHEGKEASSTGLLWVDRALGLFGDVAGDPLTYVGGVGASASAREGGEALGAAARAGGRREVGSGLARAAEQAFPAITDEAGNVVRQIPEAVDRLIADAAQRGRGGLTKAAVRRAGLSAEEEAALNLPKFGLSVFHSQPIKGTGAVAEAIENFKGSVKRWAGSTKAGEAVRRLKQTEAWGQKALIDTIRDTSASAEVRAQAVEALTIANHAQGEAYGWASRKMHTLFSPETDLGQIMKDKGFEWGNHLDEIERGAVTTPEAGAFKKFLDETYDDMAGLGVEVGKRENYVPHIVTKEARDLAEKNPEVREFLTKLSTEEGFQKARTATTTIKEANRDFLTQHGAKLYMDDARDIAQHYMADVTDAVGRATQVHMLTDMGLAKAIPEIEHVAKKAKQDIERLGRKATKFEARAMKNVQKVVDTREQQAVIAGEALKAQKADALAEARRVDREVKDLAREANKATKHQQRMEAVLDNHETALARARETVKSQRGGAGSPLQKAARLKVKELEAKIATVSAEAKAAADKVAYIMNEYNAPLGQRVQASKGFAAETKRLTAYHSELLTDAADATTHLEALKLKNTTPGDGVTLADAAYRDADQAVKLALAAKTDAEAATDLAMTAHQFAVADASTVHAATDDAIAQIDEAISKITKSRNPKSLRKQYEYAKEIEDSLQGAKALMASDDPATQLIARMDAHAAIYDVKAQAYMSEVNNAEHWIDVLNDPKFRTYVQRETDKGWAAINETHQIPDWLDQALTTKSMIQQDVFWKDAWNFYDKSLNTFKGYLIARPGFVVRNFYSSMFNVYLEAGSGALGNIKRYMGFARLIDKYPETYMEEAAAKWGLEAAETMESARKAVAATGSGQAGNEVSHGLLKGASKNPLDPNFAPINAVRRMSESVEHVIRGGHALDVLERGGSFDLAVDTVTKWHFNYRDITKFDRGVKRVMPFWTFYSRNFALQMQTFPRVLPKLNRTYFNVQRNLGAGEEPDAWVPDYYKQASGLRLPGGDANSDVKYLFPDVAPNQFVSDLGSLVQTKGGSLLSQMNPAVKMPLELQAGKQFYNQAPITDKNRGDYLMSNLLPPVGTTDRIGRQFGTGHGLDAVATWLGVSLKTNTPEMRAKAARFAGRRK